MRIRCGQAGRAVDFKRWIGAVLICASVGVFSASAAGQQSCTNPYPNGVPVPVGVPGVETIKCENYLNGVRWTIKRPEVRRRLTEYREIRFEPGEVVRIEAGGCVNTDTGKNHWRSYVNPQDSIFSKERDADRLFHGLIWIPGARLQHGGRPGIGTLLNTPLGTSLVRIGSVASDQAQPSDFIVADPPPGVEPFLRLGYEASEYEKAGYTPLPRKGNHYNRCDADPKGDAEVTITIQKRVESVDVSQTQKPFDSVATQTDVNGLLLSPQWAANLDNLVQVRGIQRQLSALNECNNFPYNGPFLARRIASPCTQQAAFDQPKHLFLTACFLEPALGRLHGHVNWSASTVMGKLNFEDLSADNDLDWSLKEFESEERKQRLGSFNPASGGRLLDDSESRPPSFAINQVLTKDSQGDGSEYDRKLWLEFASYEIPGLFSKTTGPGADWSELKYDALRKSQGNVNGAKSLFSNKTAIVSGLLNLDCVHECHAELHPVYAMAVRMRDECAPGGCGIPVIGENDHWLVFVRNFGNEGSCAHDGQQHFLDRDSFSFKIPAPTGDAVNMPSITTHEFYSDVPGLSWSVRAVPGGVLLSFSLQPNNCSRVPDRFPVFLHGSISFDWTKAGQETTAQPAVAAGATPAHPTWLPDKTVSESDVTEALAPTCKPQQNSATIAAEASNAAASETQIWKYYQGLGIRGVGGSIRDYFRPNGEGYAVLESVNGSYFVGGTVASQLFGTPLGSFEAEVTYVHSHSFKNSPAPTGVGLVHGLMGLKVQVSRTLSGFVEIKGGWTAPITSGSVAGTRLARFTDTRGTVSGGGGIVPFRGRRWSVQAAVRYLWVPAIGQHIWTLSVGPQLILHKNH